MNIHNKMIERRMTQLENIFIDIGRITLLKLLFSLWALLMMGRHIIFAKRLPILVMVILNFYVIGRRENGL